MSIGEHSDACLCVFNLPAAAYVSCVTVSAITHCAVSKMNEAIVVLKLEIFFLNYACLITGCVNELNLGSAYGAAQIWCILRTARFTMYTNQAVHFLSVIIVWIT